MKIIIILSLVLVYSYGLVQLGEALERDKWRLESEKAIKHAREAERSSHAKINKALQVQYDEISVINSNLTNDIIELQRRPERNKVSRDTRTACAGATGGELSGRNAIILARLASRADRIRASLKTCKESYQALR